MALLLDTQVIVWIGSGDRRLSPVARKAIGDPEAELFVSAVIAYEFEDLRVSGRFGSIPTIDGLLLELGAMIVDYPAAACKLIPLLPKHHPDPVDRMLIAHAIHADLTLVTADAVIREYPVRTWW